MGAKPTVAQRLIAFALSLFAVGVGQLFLSHRRRWLGWLAFGVLGTPLAALLVAPLSRSGHWVLPFALVVVTAFARPLSALETLNLDRGERPRPHALWIGAAFILSCSLVVASTLVARAFVVEAFKIPSSSMLPTLGVDDHVLVDKRATSFRRGHLVVFASPENASQDFVKRVIAVPGDSLQIDDDGHPVINGWKVPSCLVGPYAYDDAETLPPHHEGELFIEYLGDQAYVTFYDSGKDPKLLKGPWVVQRGEAYVLGDNRNNSYDSRGWFAGAGGGVPATNVRGEPIVRYLATPLDWERMGPLTTLVLPSGLASLRPALERCMANRPPESATNAMERLFGLATAASHRFLSTTSERVMAVRDLVPRAEPRSNAHYRRHSPNGHSLAKTARGSIEVEACD